MAALSGNRLAKGEHGAVVMRRFSARGREFKPGESLSGEFVLGIPLRNRRVLESQNFIQLHTQGQDAAATTASEHAAEDQDYERDLALDRTVGPHGGIVLRKFRAKGVDYPAGTRLSSEQFMAMPNRFALIRQRKLAAFGEPVADDLMS